MIHLINDYYLDADNNCYTVGIPKKNKDEKLSLVNQSITAHLTELFLPLLNGFCVIKSLLVILIR